MNKTSQVSGLFLSSVLYPFSMSCLFLGMRGIMRLGGFVASGGPYAIEHPAPDWAWILPVSIFAGAISLLVQHFYAKRTQALSFIKLAWPILFLSLGYNFMEFTFPGSGHEGLAWGWLICGVLFILMGGLPLWILIRAKVPLFKAADRVSLFPAILVSLSAAGGVYGAIYLFQRLN